MFHTEEMSKARKTGYSIEFFFFRYHTVSNEMGDKIFRNLVFSENKSTSIIFKFFS